MVWTVRWEKRAIKDVAQFSKADRERIGRFLHERVRNRENPREVGEALAGRYAGHWKYRVGDFRIIASIDDRLVTILVVRVGNRREVYR
jgi:mRNA interferase RelE/StbE